MSLDLTRLNVTRDELDTREITKLLTRAREFERAIPEFFADLLDCRERLGERGLVFDIELCAGFAAWFSAWKQGRAREAGRELARTELGEWTPLEDLVK